MEKPMKLLGTLCISMTILFHCTIGFSPRDAYAESALLGKPAPDFSLSDASGKMVHLSDFKDKIVVLEWYNPECPFVKKFYNVGAMQRFQEQLTAQGVVWLTITSNAKGKQGYISQDEAPKALSRAKMASTTLLLDHEGVVGKSYGASTTPHMFVIDKAGNLAYAGGIDDKASTRSSDIEGANNFVLQAVAELKNGEAVSVPHTSPYGCSVKYR